MTLFTITRHGLVSIAIAVALLWGCIALDHLIVYNANREAQQALQAIRNLKIKRQLEPASNPTRERRDRGWHPAVVPQHGTSYQDG